MAEISTIARPYAEALYAAAVADSPGQTIWFDTLPKIAALADQADVQAVFADPRHTADQIFDLIFNLLSDVQGVANTVDQAVDQIPQGIKNFIRLLIDNQRLNVLPEIVKQFLRLKNQHEGLAQATVTSAFALDQAQLADLLLSLEKHFGVKLLAQVHVDPSLIGGVRVEVGDQVLDSSVKARLQAMQDNLCHA